MTFQQQLKQHFEKLNHSPIEEGKIRNFIEEKTIENGSVEKRQLFLAWA